MVEIRLNNNEVDLVESTLVYFAGSIDLTGVLDKSPRAMANEIIATLKRNSPEATAKRIIKELQDETEESE